MANPYFDIAGTNGVTVRVYWSETNSIEKNQSVVTITDLQVMSSWYSGVTYYLDGTISVDDSVAVTMDSNTGTHPVTLSDLDTFYSVDGTLGAVSEITHNDDGSKAVTIAVSIKGYTRSGGGGSGWSVSGSQAVTLTTIPRKSTLSASNGTLGTAQTLTVTKKADSFTHTILYTCGTIKNQTICSKSSETSISWTPSINLASQNTTGTSVAITLTITTYSGSTSVGSNSISITCAIPASVAPSCSIAVSDDTELSSTYGAMVKGYSKMAVTVTATKSYGSEISAYRVTANGSVYNTASFVTGVLKSSGTLSVAATVTDKRGRTGSASESVSVLDYSAPSVTLLKVGRCDEDGTANDSGEYTKVTISGTVTSLNNKNSATYTLEYKKTTDSSYTAVTLTDLADTYSVSNYTYIFAADSGSSYDVRLTITDDLSSGNRSTVVSTGATIMHWKANGKGMGIGKVSEIDDTLDMGWHIKMNGNKISGLATPTEDGDAVPLGYATIIKLLWTNASPGSTFAAQTISLDLSEYDLVFIKVRLETGSTSYISAMMEVGSAVNVYSTSYIATNGYTMATNYRTLTIANDGIECGDAYRKSYTATTSGTANNILLIPVKVFGIKGVQ